MAAFLIVLFIFVIIALGMAKLAAPFMRRPDPKPKAERLPTNAELRALILTLRNEGYYGRTRMRDEDIIYVDNPIITEMIEELATKYDLRWKLPAYRLRVRKVGNRMPEWITERFTHVLMTPTHAIGFTPKPKEEEPVYS